MNNFQIKSFNGKYLPNCFKTKERYHFQYTYIMRVVPTNQLLTKCNIVGSALCEFCSMGIITVSHLFWECAHVHQFWTSVSDLLRLCDSNINITVN